MSPVYNFSAGPAAIPRPVLERAQAELLDFQGTGTSVMEISHRGETFLKVAAHAEASLKALLNLPSNYKILFMQGGGFGEFSIAPLNLLGKNNKADYVNTGHWSTKGIAEAKRYADVHVAANSEANQFTSVPDVNTWSVRQDAAYLHICTNETIHGVEFAQWQAMPDLGVPLVADMSSHILSRPMDVSKYGVIYAGAQKNIGPSGLTLVIIRDDLLDQAMPHCPAVFNYGEQLKHEWMLNTPNTWGVYLAGLTFDWLREQGGLAGIEKINDQKQRLLYSAIDNSNGFYRNEVAKPNRSWMNVPFFLKDEALNADFLAQAKANGLLFLKGHRAVGGMRASIYNAVPLEGVQALVAFMNDFASKKS
jgi:phosphoserine aminotransferase